MSIKKLAALQTGRFGSEVPNLSAQPKSLYPFMTYDTLPPLKDSDPNEIFPRDTLDIINSVRPENDPVPYGRMIPCDLVVAGSWAHFWQELKAVFANWGNDD